MSQSNKPPPSLEVKRVPPALLDIAKQVLERSVYQMNQMSQIRHSLFVEKSEQFLSSEKMVLLPNEGRTEPGFICFFPNSSILFINSRMNQGQYLRLRVDESLHKGTVFIGTLDAGHLTFEDCIQWKGVPMYDTSFSKRFAHVSTFFHTECVLDERLSVLKLHIASLHPLSDLQKLVNSNQYWSIDFIPEAPKRRRFFYRLPTMDLQQVNIKTYVQQTPIQTKKSKQREIQQKNILIQKDVQKDVQEETHEGKLVAIAKNIQGLPDTYDLFSYDKIHIGEAAVQSNELSNSIKDAILKTPSLTVFVEWNPEFDCYEITGLANNATIHKSSAFKITQTQTQKEIQKEETHVYKKPIRLPHSTSQYPSKIQGTWQGIEED